MKTRVVGMLMLAAAAGSLVWLTPIAAQAQAKGKAAAPKGVAKAPAAAKGGAYKAPRSDDGKSPNLQGIWLVNGWDTSRYGLEWHGAATGIRPGKGSVTSTKDGLIPYKPEARKKQAANLANHVKLDPLNACYMTGVPRFVTSGFPFQIIQTPKLIILASEYTHMIRYVHLDRQEHIYDGSLDFWLGDSTGKWDGDTLVVDTWNQNDQTWYDMSGSPHSGNLKVTERFTRTGENTMDYTATMTDPDMLTAPFTIAIRLERNADPNAQLMEYECHSYKEDDAKAGQ